AGQSSSTRHSTQRSHDAWQRGAVSSHAVASSAGEHATQCPASQYGASSGQALHSSVGSSGSSPLEASLWATLVIAGEDAVVVSLEPGSSRGVHAGEGGSRTQP